MVNDTGHETMGSLALEDRWIGVSARTPGGDVRARKSRACQCPANATRPPEEADPRRASPKSHEGRRSGAAPRETPQGPRW